MTNSPIYVGNTEAVQATFRNAKGELTDPTNVVLSVTSPDATTAHTYSSGTSGTAGHIARASKGVYTFDVFVSVKGSWSGTWTVDGNGVDLEEPFSFKAIAAPADITFAIVDQTGAAVHGLLVSVYTLDGAFVTSERTDDEGVALIRLNNEMSFMVELEGDRIAPDKRLVFVDASIPTALTVTSLDIASLVPARSVWLYGYVQDAEGRPASSRVVIENVGGFKRSSLTMAEDQNSGIDPRNVGVNAQRREVRSNNLTGLWGASVAAGSRVHVTVPSLRLSKSFTVPDDPRVSVLNIVDARVDVGPGGDVNVSSDVPTFDPHVSPD